MSQGRFRGLQFYIMDDSTTAFFMHSSNFDWVRLRYQALQNNGISKKDAFSDLKKVTVLCERMTWKQVSVGHYLNAKM